jgi:hypothetical protein
MKLKKFLAATTPMYEALFGETSGGAGSPESGARSGDLPVEPVQSDLVVPVVDTGSAI